MTRRSIAYFGLFFVAGILVGCQVNDPIPLTATSLPQVEPTTIAERPFATTSYTPTFSVTPTLTETAVPIETQPSASTATIAITLTPTAAPQLSEDFPSPATWTNIGTAVPQSTNTITAENVTALTEVARWGKGSILEALYSPDGNQLYVLTGQGLYLYDAHSAQELEFRRYAYAPRSMALSADGQTLAFIMGNKRIELRDAKSNSFITAFEPFADIENNIHRIDLDPSKEFLFIRASTGVVVWDLNRAMPVAQLTVDKPFTTYAMAPAAALVATTSDEDGVVRLWQWQDEEFALISELEVPESMDSDASFHTLSISPYGDYVALGDIYLSIAVWQVSDGQLLHILDERRINSLGKRRAPALLSGPGRHVIADLEFSPDSQLLAEATGFANVTLWQMSDGQPKIELEDVGDQVMFTPDNTAVATWNYTLGQWSIEDGRLINTLNQHIGHINDLALIPNRGQLAIASADRFIYLRQLNDGGLVTSLQASESNSSSYFSPSARAIDVSSNGNTLVSASNDAYRVWNLNDNSMISLTLPYGSAWGASDILISFDSKYVVGQEAEFGPPLFMWEADKENVFTETNLFAPLGLDFSPTDLLLATTSIERVNDVIGFVLWQPNTNLSQDLFLGLDLEDLFVEKVSFSPDGRFLAASTGDSNHLLIWTINNLEAEFMHVIDIPEPPIGPDEIKDIAFSPDNELLVVSSNWRVEIYDVDNGRLLHTFYPSSLTQHVLFSEDGRYLIIGHGDGSARFWMVP